MITITGTLETATGKPRANINVKFVLASSFGAGTDSYIAGEEAATRTGSDGAFSVDVAVPTSGTAPYDVYIADSKTRALRVNLSASMGTIDLATLIADAGTEDVPTVSALIAAQLALLELDDLANVDMADKADGDVPVWNATTEKWEPGAGGGGGSVAWGDITGKPTTLAGYGIDDDVTALLAALALDDLADVSAAAPNSGDVLTWDGSAWVASAPSGGGDFLPLAGGTLTGRILAPTGSLAAPSYGFSADGDSGLTLNSDGNGLILVTNGESAAFIRRDVNILYSEMLKLGAAARTALEISGNQLRIATDFTSGALFYTATGVLYQQAASGIPVMFDLAREGGTPATGTYGAEMQFKLLPSTGGMERAGALRAVWGDHTTASRQGDLMAIAADYGGDREIWRGRANGSAPAIGFLGATPIARPTVTGSAGGNAALASLLTALATLGLITDSSS